MQTERGSFKMPMTSHTRRDVRKDWCYHMLNVYSLSCKKIIHYFDSKKSNIANIWPERIGTKYNASKRREQRMGKATQAQKGKAPNIKKRK